MRKARSFLSAVDLQGQQIEAELVHCCHCGHTLGSVRTLLFQRMRGGGAFGYCARCDALHCPSCQVCAPQEQRCENVEAGRAPDDNGTAIKLYLPIASPG